jgi:hypothetical protein
VGGYVAGRRSKYREFLHTLGDVIGLQGAALANALGKESSNISQYLSGYKKVGPRTLRSAVYHLGEWEVTAVLEVARVPENLSELPQSPGIYAFYDSSASILYVGQATQLRAEITSALNRNTNFPVRSGPQLQRKRKPRYKDVTKFISAYEVPSPRLRHNLEALLLRVFPNQSHNNKLGNFR